MSESGPGEEAGPMGERVRLQRYLRRAGVASRRDSEDLIRQGRVTVDGETVTELGTRVGDAESVRVAVDGEVVEPRPARWVALHKPAGVITSRNDPEDRRTVYDLLPDGPIRDLFHVGRLDYMSEGLLLLSNEGDVANRLLHPSRRVGKRYEVGVAPPVPDGIGRRLLDGVELDDGPASANAAARIPADDGAIVLLTLHEGRNREIRRMMAEIGVTIRYLRRLSFGPVDLGDLPPGGWRELDGEEVRDLRQAASGGGTVDGSPEETSGENEGRDR